MFAIGIDPGLNGAIGFLNPDGSYRGVYDLPTVEIPSGTITRRVDGAELAIIIGTALPGDAHAICYIEDVQPYGGNPLSMGALMGSKLAVWAVLDLFKTRITVRLVVPQAWKKHFGLKKNKTLASDLKIAADYKRQSRVRAVGLYPMAPIRAAEDHDRAEALLLANYARFVWGTETDIFAAATADAPRVLTPEEIHAAEVDSRVPLR